MKILLIGNFAPPYEEENLSNISLFKKLEEDGHECTVINISETPSGNGGAINAGGTLGYFFKLLWHSRNKDVIHFFTKGYLRVGLLKLMLSVFVGTVMRTKTILTIHSEFFSILGQMRSPFGGTQTLFTSFYLADRIIFHDRETYDTAKAYMKKSNFELVPGFIYIPADIEDFDTSRTVKMKDMNAVVVFANVKYPSFLLEVLTELVTGQHIPDNTALVIALPDKPSLKLEHALEDSSGPLRDNLIFVEYDDEASALKLFSKAGTILRPMSCDGTTFFEGFSFCLRKTRRSGKYVYFPSGLVFIKEGNAAPLCTDIIDRILSSEPETSPEVWGEDPYEKIIEIYKNK